MICDSGKYEKGRIKEEKTPTPLIQKNKNAERGDRAQLRRPLRSHVRSSRLRLGTRRSHLVAGPGGTLLLPWRGALLVRRFPPRRSAQVGEARRVAGARAVIAQCPPRWRRWRSAAGLALGRRRWRGAAAPPERKQPMPTPVPTPTPTPTPRPPHRRARLRRAAGRSR